MIAATSATRLMGGNPPFQSAGTSQPSMPSATRCAATNPSATYPRRWLRFQRRPPIAFGIIGSVVIAGDVRKNRAMTPTAIAISPSRLRRPSARKYFP